MNYVLVQHGCPRVVTDLPPYKPNRLAILRRDWEHCHGFSDTSRYAISMESEPPSTLLQRILAHTVFNPVVPVTAAWRPIGERRTADILALVEAGLRHDDDILQQFFEAADVMRLLKAADGWDELLLAVRCVCGEHEMDDVALRFVRTVLPNYSERDEADDAARP